MRRLSASVLFLLASTLAFAQTSNNSPTPRNAQSLPLNSGCPVDFSANRQASGRILSAGDDRQSGPTLGLHLTLNNRKMPAIESIKVRIYGVSQKGLYLPTGDQSTETVSKTFELHRTSADESLNEADVWMNLTGSLSWADLISITYRNGETWHTNGSFTCRAIAPNSLLVGSK